MRKVRHLFMHVRHLYMVLIYFRLTINNMLFKPEKFYVQDVFIPRVKTEIHLM